MPGTQDRLRIQLLLHALIPFVCLVLCVPMAFAYLRGVPEPTSNVVALCSVVVGVAWWVIVGRLSFSIDDTGVRRSSPFGENALRWDEIVEYRYAAAPPVHVDGALAAAAVASLSGGTLTLHSADGRRLSIGAGWSGAPAAITRIAERLDAARRTQLATALQDRAPVTFGCITVQHDGLACGDKELLPWSDLTSVQVFAGNLLVRRNGRKRSYFKVRIKALPHLFLLLQILADHGVRIVRD